MTDIDLTGKIITAHADEDRHLANMPPEAEAAWRAWLDQYGLDPMRIQLPAKITADYAAGTITVAPFAHGQDPFGDDTTLAAHTIQLDEPPAPFPPDGLELVVQDGPVSSEDQA